MENIHILMEDHIEVNLIMENNMVEALLLHHRVKLKKEFGKMVKGFNG